MAVIYWPFSTSLVSEWPGTRPAGWADHVGTDFAVPQGTPLRATMAGTVDIIWNDGLGAWVIDIISPDGTVVRNGHLSYMAPADGAWVNVGDYIGNTGGALGTPGAGLSTGSHLHWEIRNNTGWGAEGWYDPRNLTIYSFGPSSGGSSSAPIEEDIVTEDDIEKIAKRTAQLVLERKVKTYKGGSTSLGRFLKYEDNRFDWLKARITRLLGKK